jgi:hypothetical protein
MTDQNKIRLKGISRLWGYGGQQFPYHNGNSGDSIREEKLDNQKLSAKEYFQYTSAGAGTPPKFIIHDLNKNVLECVKCKDTTGVLEPCNNCDNNDKLFWFNGFEYVDNKYPGLKCNSCQKTHQQNRWICSKCGCDNYIGNTLYHEVELEIPKKEGCFIATVCYGDYNSNEVLVLRQFRDNKLRKSFIGNAFINFYYFTSPFFASLISKSNVTKKIIREFFLNPIVLQLKKSKENDADSKSE